MTRVVHEDDTYSLVLPPDLETEALRFDGVFTWEYIGQARYPLHPVIPDESIVVEPDFVLTSMWYDPEAYFGVGTTTQDDLYGRLWLLVEVDLAAAAHKIEDYDERVRELFGEEEVDRSAGIEYPEHPGLVEVVDLQGWTVEECDSSDPMWEIYNHDSDHLTRITSTYNERQRKVVVVWVDLDELGTFMCSGALVDNDTVLTAAHCFANEDGYFASASDLTVCSYGNLQSGAECIGASLRATQGGTYDGTRGDDYAVIHLSDSFDLGWFALTAASDSTVSGHPDFHRGYPLDRTGCVDNLSYSGVVDGDYPGASLHRADGVVQGTPAGHIRFDTSTADGMSGSPHFYCPNPDSDGDGDVCEHGHWITAVQSGAQYNALLDSGHSYGVEARSIRDWVISHL